MYYRLMCDSENYRNYYLTKTPSTNEPIKIYDSFDGTPLKDIYTKLSFDMTRKSEAYFPIADYTNGGVPICSEKMKNIIESIANKDEIEFLPCTLESVNETYYILHILNSIDCVDYEKSKFTKFPSSGRIMFFDHIEFKEKINSHFFRLKDLSNDFYFISEEAKNLLEKSELKGLIFSDALFK